MKSNPLYALFKKSKTFVSSETCPKCGVEKPYTDFYIARATNTTRYIRLDNQCKECAKVKARLRKYKTLYGISMDILQEMFKECEGKCQICGVTLTLPKYNGNKEMTTAHIDHCHITKRVRGLLCHHCNVGLGSFKDSSSILQKAQEYLNDP